MDEEQLKGLRKYQYGKLHKAIQCVLRVHPTEKEVILNTPERYVKALKELLSGYWQDPTEIISKTFPQQTAMVYEVCEFYSLCEHHMLPFFGKVHIAYIPTGKVVGLSKLARLVEVYSRRLQIQERLGEQIADALWKHKELKPAGVFVIVEGQHLCMMMRGIKKQNAITITKAMRGSYKQSSDLRKEFLMILRTRKTEKTKKTRKTSRVVQRMRKITEAIRRVWQEHDNINNWLGVYWLIQKQLEEIKEDKFVAETFLKEMADILIIIIRYFDKIGIDPEKAVMHRLKTRHEGRTIEINKKYDKLFVEDQKRREET